MCLHQITVTNNNNNNNNNMEDTHGTNLGRLPREPLLQPLLPAKATKRKRLNAVLDKLASNIKVAPESPDDDGDNNLEFEINVKTKIKKESDPSSESEESDNERRNVELSDTDRSPRSSVSDIKDDVDSPNICLSPNHIKAEPEKSFSKNSNVFFNDSRQPSPKLQESPLSQLRLAPLPNQPTSPTTSVMSTYEQYIKSQLLSKMYLQQYMTNNLTKPYALPQDRAECTKTDPHHSQHSKSQSKVISKDNSSHQVFLDGPLDLSTRQTDTLAIVTKDSLAQSIKERLYCQQFPFPPFPPMLMQNPSLQARSHDETPSSKIKQEQHTPVVETSSTKKDPAYVCPICGQMFSLHDRLAKHMASRHKSKASDASSKAYFCDVCKRSFARSDMLTRHMRLHTGIKPYTCRVCGQVFSRSDHLSTHQRTHTGEKPYKCPSCPYSACRRDMITRHMRTHSRYELQDSSSIIPEDSDKESNGHGGASKNTSGEDYKFVKEEVVDS